MITAGIIPEGKGTSAQVQAMRTNIMQRGTQGLHFMQEAEDEAKRAINQGKGPAESDIERIWNS